MARQSRRNPDPVRVVAAQIAGTAERCIVGQGLTEDEALVDIGGALAAIGPGQPRQSALAYALARYVDETTDAATAIVALLRRAGADVDRARRIRAQRASSFIVR